MPNAFPPRRRRTVVAAALSLVVLSAAATAPAQAPDSSDPLPNEFQVAWSNGATVELYVSTPAPMAPPPGVEIDCSQRPPDMTDPSLPIVNQYLIAPVQAKAPQGMGIVIPPPPCYPSDRLVVPRRDLVLSQAGVWGPRSAKAGQPVTIGEHMPANCMGNYVVLGRKAKTRGKRRNVYTRRDPNGSGIKLAYAIVVGGKRVSLTSEDVIKKGAAMGLLQIDPSLGYGGTCWMGKPSQFKPRPPSPPLVMAQ